MSHRQSVTKQQHLEEQEKILTMLPAMWYQVDCATFGTARHEPAKIENFPAPRVLEAK
jgi:hypothetical protein